MNLHIAPDRTLAALQSEFSEAFPGLKIVFFSRPHHEYKGIAAKFLVQDKELLLQALSPDIRSGDIVIEPKTPVCQLERLFEEEYGLYVQVFRKSGKSWLQTSATDDLTLEQQQIKAADSEKVHRDFMDTIDYREQD